MHVARWQAISTHIAGLVRATDLFSKFQDFDTWKYLRDNCRSILAEVSQFAAQHKGLIPSEFYAAYSTLSDLPDRLGRETPNGAGLERKFVSDAIIRLCAFEAWATYILSDSQEQLKSRVEVALIHLSRLIAVDRFSRQLWSEAFAKGETACESLGATHLLLHGIFAFKAHAAKGRTDLVLPGGASGLDRMAAYASGAVLTEWKIAKNQIEADVRFEEAKKQANLYVFSVLAGMELRSVRYLIIVTEKQIAAPADTIEDGVTYRHINIAVAPETPSKAAKATRGRQPSLKVKT